LPSPDSLLTELTSGDASRAEAAVPRLAALGSETVEALLALLAAPDVDTRWWCVRALVEMDAEGARTAVRQALGDADPSVRQCAALGLRGAIRLEDVEALLPALGDSDPLVRRLAGDALSALGAEAVRPLSAAARATNPAVRIEAMRALARCGRPEAIPALLACLEDPSALVHHWAERGLEDLGQGMIYIKP
jgi:HEAT repeat protein